MSKRKWLGDKATVLKIRGGWITVKPGQIVELVASDADAVDKLQDWTETDEPIEKEIEASPSDKSVKPSRRKTK